MLAPRPDLSDHLPTDPDRLGDPPVGPPVVAVELRGELPACPGERLDAGLMLSQFIGNDEQRCDDLPWGHRAPLLALHDRHST